MAKRLLHKSERIKVAGYTRKDGTRVASYYRKRTLYSLLLETSGTAASEPQEPISRLKKAGNWPDIIRRAFEEARDRAKVQSFFSVVPNPDNSVESEIRFIRPTGYSPKDLLIDVEDWLTVPKGAWVSVGVRFAPTTAVVEHVKDPKRGSYYMQQGMISIASYGQRGRQVAANFAEARHAAKVMAERTKRQPLEVFVRLRWDPDDKKMPHKGKTVVKRKRKKGKKSL